MRTSFIFLFLIVIQISLLFGQKNQPLNVVLLIGDGMGLSQVSSVNYYGNDPSAFEQFQNIGLVKTSSATHKITDSAAGATAFATGKKTYNGGIGVTVDTVWTKNITEILSEKGYMTGVVATSSVTDATPAGFYAHVASRTFKYSIAEELLRSEIDYFAGGGLMYFRDILSDDSIKAIVGNKKIVIDTVEFKRVKRPIQNTTYGFLLADDGMPPFLNGRGDFLPNSTKEALRFLSKSEKGFFLMVEGSQIDWAGHSNHVNYMLTEVRDFNKTINEVLKFAKKNKNTLVIVTADHETGGFALASDPEFGYDGYNMLKPAFATKEHSATMVPLFAKGPKEELFRGIYENNELFDKILDAINSYK